MGLFPASLHPFLKNHKAAIAVVGAVLLVQALLLVLLPLPIRAALDLIQTSRPDLDQVARLSLATLGLGLLAALFEYLEERGTARLVLQLISTTRADFLQLLLSRKAAWLDSQRKADLLARLSGDVSNLEIYVSSTLIIAVRSVPSLVFAAAAMFWIHSGFAAVLLAILALIYGGSVFISQRLKNSERRARSRQVGLEQDLLQSFSSMSLIKSLRAEKATLTVLADRQTQVNEAFFQTRHWFGVLNSLFSSARHVLRALVLLGGAWGMMKGYLTLGTLFAFVSYLESLSKPVLEIANYLSRSAKAATSLERLDDLRAQLQTAAETSGHLHPAPQPTSSLRLRDLSFAYPHRPPLFSHLNFDFEPGELIAIVGASGAGKTSFIKLLNRLEDPTNGALILDEVPLTEWQLSELRKAVVVISQDPFLLSATVRENLNFGEVPATDESLWGALTRAHADTFVQGLASSLETSIGEAGAQLSGGQTKRLSLARAFMREKTARVLVFDEPTSGLDPMSAQHIMASLAELTESKSLILFSTHRMEEVLLADRVLFFRKGENPRLATHIELLQQDADYRRMLQELAPEATP